MPPPRLDNNNNSDRPAVVEVEDDKHMDEAQPPCHVDKYSLLEMRLRNRVVPDHRVASQEVEVAHRRPIRRPEVVPRRK